MKKHTFVFTALMISASSAFAHFPIFIHDTPFASMNEPVEFMFAQGHPYEQEFVDAIKPSQVIAHYPSGKVEELTEQMVEGTYTVDDVTAQTWDLTYAPDQTGDILIELNSEPVFGLNNTVYQEYLKTVLHTEEQFGWDELTGQPIEIQPLTRPYGLEAGSIFTGRLLVQGEPLANAQIDIEQFLTFVPNVDDLPPEPLITKVVKTDDNGVFSYTLPNAGWWILAATIDEAGSITIEDQEYTLSGLGALWLHVEEPVNLSPNTSIQRWSNR